MVKIYGGEAWDRRVSDKGNVTVKCPCGRWVRLSKGMTVVPLHERRYRKLWEPMWCDYSRAPLPSSS